MSATSSLIKYSHVALDLHGVGPGGDAPRAAMGYPRRQRNERKFPNWEELPGGGRRYWYDIEGRSGWTARYVKLVDSNESTLRFYQKIFDEAGALREVHNKFPADLGHRRIGDEEQE